MQSNTCEGNALQVSSCCTQTSGELVTVTGTEQYTALQVVDGDVRFGYCDQSTFSPVMTVTNAASSVSSSPDTSSRVRITNPSTTDGATLLRLEHNGTSGKALVITNSGTQASGELVHITGASGQTALHVVTGNTELGGALDVDGATTLNDTLGVAKATTLSDTLVVAKATTLSDTLGVAKATTLSDTTINGATTINNTFEVTPNSTSSSHTVVTIDAPENQTALCVSQGHAILEDGIERTPIGRSIPSTGRFQSLCVDSSFTRDKVSTVDILVQWDYEGTGGLVVRDSGGSLSLYVDENDIHLTEIGALTPAYVGIRFVDTGNNINDPYTLVAEYVGGDWQYIKTDSTADEYYIHLDTPTSTNWKVYCSDAITDVTVQNIHDLLYDYWDGSSTTLQIILFELEPTMTSDALYVAGDAVVDGELRVNGKIILPPTTHPSSHNEAGVAGEIRYDATYLYICTATNIWHRTPLSTW